MSQMQSADKCECGNMGNSSFSSPKQQENCCNERNTKENNFQVKDFFLPVFRRGVQDCYVSSEHLFYFRFNYHGTQEGVG